MTLDEKLTPLMNYLETEIRDELVRQGHVATGNLRDQIKVYLQNHTIIGSAGDAFYAKYVDWGRRPGGKRVPIQVLVNWIEIKGFASGDKAVKMAWAVQYSIWKNGIPTDKDEGKKKFVSRVLENNREKIFDDIEKSIGFYFNAEIENIIRQVKYVSS